MIPDATEEQMRWLDELQRMAVTADTAVVARAQRQNADVRHLLPRLDVPTLVLQCRDEKMNSFAQARHLASHIDGARLVALESNNHILLADEPAWPHFVREVDAFLEPDREAARHRPRRTAWPSPACCPPASSTCSAPPPSATTTTPSPPPCT